MGGEAESARIMQTGKWLWGALAVVIVVAAIAFGPRIYRQIDARRTASAALALLYAGNEANAIARLQQASPHTALTAWNLALRELYWERRSVPAVVGLGRAGLEYGRREAGSPDEKLRLKVLAYNLSSCTWPGWADGPPGYVYSKEDLDTGLDAARLNLELARELERPAEAQASAHWLLGAQLLAAGAYAEATSEFETAADWSTKAGDPAAEAMARGFVMITRIARHPADDAARDELDRIATELRGLERGSFYADQFEPALSAFLEP